MPGTPIPALRRGLLISLLIIGHVAAAEAQQWPTRPVHIVVPFAAGGSTDVLARVYSEQLAQRLGQPVVIENRPGGGGNLGPAVVSKAPADGNMMFVGAAPGYVNSAAVFKNPGYDAERDFAAVAMLATQAMMLTLHPSLPPNTLGEFIAYAKANPGKFNYASPGVGSPNFLAMELLKSIAGLDIVHVPYRGGGPMTQDVIAGQVGVMFASYATIGPHLQSGKLKVVAASGKGRIPQAPEIRTIAEQGLAGYQVDQWYGLLAPVGTPPAAIARMAMAIREVAALKEVRERLLQLGYEAAMETTPAEFSNLIRRDIVKWSDVVRRAGIKPE